MSKPRTISDYPNRADDYDQAVSKSHDQNTDIALDEGGDHEVTAEAIRDHVDSTDNPHGVTAEQVGAYTKQETDDLLDGKADQSALNATNQAVSNLDGRVDTAEDDIQGLEDGKANLNGGNTFSGTQQISTTTTHNRYYQRQIANSNLSASGIRYILLCDAEYSTPDTCTRVIGTIAGGDANWTGILMRINSRLDLTGGGDGWLLDYEISCVADLVNFTPVECDYNGRRYYAIRLASSFSNSMPTQMFFNGVHAGDGIALPLMVPSSSVDNVSTSPGMSPRPVNAVVRRDSTVHTGTVTATEFITTSRVESDRENALSALDNISEWKKKDGTIDYKKHYAYTPRIIKDEKGKVIEEIPGLGLEKRVAMLEKMVWELKDRNEGLQAKLDSTKRK